MPIDPSIPLQAGQNIPQFGPDLKQLITLQNLAQQMQARKLVMDQESQGQNALRQVFGNKDNIDQSTGLPKPQALAPVIQANPEMGQNLLKTLSTTQHNQALTQAQQGKLHQDFLRSGYDTMQSMVSAYDSNLKTVGPDRAGEIAKDEYNRSVDDLASSGIYPPKWIEAIRNKAPPVEEARARANNYVMSQPKIQEKIVGAQLKANEPPTPYQQGQQSETQRHHLAMEQDYKRKTNELYTGDVPGPDGKPVPTTLRRDPSGQGFVSDETGEHVTPAGPPHKIGTKSEADASGITDEDAKYFAQMYNLTGRFPSMYRDHASREKIMHAAAEDARQSGKAPGDVAAQQAGLRADTMSLGQLSKVTDAAEAYEKTAIENMKIVEDKMPKGVGTSWPWLNRWVQEGRIGLGDPDVPPYAASLVTVANEYAKVMSGATGAQASTVDARREAAELLNKAQNTEQVRAVLDVMRRDMENKRREYRDQLGAIKGRIKAGGEATPIPPTETPASKPTDSGMHIYQP